MWDLFYEPGARGVFAFIVFVVMAGFGIAGWIMDGWIAGLSVFVGAISSASFIFTLGEGWAVSGALGVASLALFAIGFNQNLHQYQQTIKDGSAAFQRAYGACARGDAERCEKGIRVFTCEYLKATQELAQTAKSAAINTSLPKEFGGLYDVINGSGSSKLAKCGQGR